MYKNNLLLLGWDLGTWVWGGCGDKETGCRYQSVHKQPFRLGLGDLGLGGDLGTRRHGVGIKVYINNLLGWDLGKKNMCALSHENLCSLALQHASYLLLAAVYLGPAT